MKRASAAKPRAPPKKAKYANAYKVAFEADFVVDTYRCIKIKVLLLFFTILNRFIYA